ncbi:MAG: TraR/DksA family transcriptional regulator, partial [Pseudomonadota bacterium]|nr:TraR/DksA family transcriptional regulator [Pseudomonadota bacterium]
RSDAHDYSNLAGRVHDPGEESIADLLVDVNLEMIRKHKDELRDVEAAMQRLETGTYGQCSDCGSDIDYPRLQAAPAARRCIDCQRRFEQNYQGGGTPTL